MFEYREWQARLDKLEKLCNENNRCFKFSNLVSWYVSLLLPFHTSEFAIAFKSPFSPNTSIWPSRIQNLNGQQSDSVSTPTSSILLACIFDLNEWNFAEDRIQTFRAWFLPGRRDRSKLQQPAAVDGGNSKLGKISVDLTSTKCEQVGSSSRAWGTERSGHHDCFGANHIEWKRRIGSGHSGECHLLSERRNFVWWFLFFGIAFCIQIDSRGYCKMR